MAKKNPFTVADYLLTRLLQLNVTDVFQIPGDYVKHFTQALEHFKGIKTIGASNELDASYAADAYARTRGLAAVSLQYGVSTYSALNAIAGAYVERSPVVVISACPGSDARKMTDMYGMLFHHSTGNLMDDEEIYKRVTVGAITLSSSENADEKIDNLLIAALTERRPVYIACYKEVWAETIAPPKPTPLKPRPIFSSKANLQNAVAQAWSQISVAQNPLILAGVEILRFGLSDVLQELLDASGMLYTTTTLGKTVLNEGGKKFIGTYADQASIPNVIQTVQNSDCIISLGTIITDDYVWLVENKFANMVLCATYQTRAGYFTYQGIQMREFMEALIKLFKANKTYPLKTIAPAQPVYPEPWLSNSDPKYTAQPEVITFNRFFQHSMKFLNDNKMLKDIVMTYGVSSSMYLATNAYGLYQNSFISSAAWQCIGFETGAALGAQLGSGKRAWTVAGDGGFRMVCQALSTLAHNKANAVIFVMNNGVYAIEQVYVDITAFKAGNEHKFDAFDILPTWNYKALAEAFGTNYYKASTVTELNDVLKQLKKPTQLPTLVEVVMPQKVLPQQMYRLEQG